MAISTASLIFTGGLGATAATLTATQIIIGGVVYLGVSSVVASALMPKPKMPKMGGGSGLSNTIDPIADFEIVYGETRKGGVKTFLQVNGDNKFLHQIIVLAGHEVNSIGDIFLNDEVVTLDSNGFVTSNDYDSKILIKKFTGTSTQNISTSLSVPSGSAPTFPSGFQGRGIACLYVRMEYDADVFSNGVPVVTAKVQGKKLYDPRKDSTSSAYDSSLGVSTHRTNDASTWQYSDEPALAIRDYLTSNLGLGAKQASIEDDDIATAITKCATTGIGGSEENSLKVGGVLTTGATPLENLNMLLTSLNGTLFWSQGKWKLIAGAFYTADSSVSGSNAFSYKDIIGDVSVATRFSRRDTVNTVRGTFVDAENRYIATDYPEQQIPDLSEDNNEVSTLDLQLPMTTKSAAAQRLAKQILFVGREQITLSATFKIEKAFAVQVGDTVELTLDRYGFSQKSFRVMNWSMAGLDGSAPSINMVLQETSSTAYQWSVSADEYQAITANNTTLGDAQAGLAINNLTATANSNLATDGTAIPRISLDWDDVTSPIFDHFLVEYRRTGAGASDFQGITVLSSNAEITGLIAGVEYEIRVTAFTVKQNGGVPATTTITAVSDTTAPSVPSAPTVTAGVKQLEVQWEGYTFPSDFSLMEVHHSTTSGGTFTRVGSVRGTGFVHSGLTQNTTHYYKLKAKDFSGNLSAFSTEGNGTVAADVQGPQGPAGQSGLAITLNGADIPMNKVTGEPPVESGVDPRPNNSTTQAKLDEAFLAVNPILSSMNDIPSDATVWGRFVLVKEQTFTTTASQLTFTLTGGHTPDEYTRVIYDDNELIKGDFTSAAIDSSGNSASITLTDQFLNRFNLSAVPADKTVEVYYIQASARKWDYANQDWTDNADVFDTPVVFSPLVLSKEVLTQALAANQITAGQLVVNKDVDLLDGAAWRIGKTDYSDTADGIFFGNPSGSGATNYSFAFTATSNSGTSTEHGIEITPQETKLIQPTITKQATGAVSVSDQHTATSTDIDIKTTTTNPNARTVTINAIGGGGGGAGAESQSGSAGAGGDTSYTLTITGGSQAGTYNITASGGAAATGYGAAKTDGDPGENSARASGGYGGGHYQPGGDGELGSGGGGGGGKDYNWLTGSNKGGAGGRAGQHVSNTFDISDATTVRLDVTAVGAGGSGMGSSRGDGGDGGTGVVYGTIETVGLDPVILKTETEYNLGVIGDGQLYSQFNMGQNTVYTNNGPKPVFISVRESTAGDQDGFLYARGSSTDGWIMVGRRGDNNLNEILGCAVIPVGGAFYKTNNGTTTCALLGSLS